MAKLLEKDRVELFEIELRLRNLGHLIKRRAGREKHPSYDDSAVRVGQIADEVHALAKNSE
jgi:hypothetical protein